MKTSAPIKLTYPKFTPSKPKYNKKGEYDEAHWSVCHFPNGLTPRFKTKKEADAFYNRIKDFKTNREALIAFAQYEHENYKNAHPNVKESIRAQRDSFNKKPVYPSNNRDLELADFTIVERGTYFEFERYNSQDGEYIIEKFVFDCVTATGVLGWSYSSYSNEERWDYGEFIDYGAMYMKYEEMNIAGMKIFSQDIEEIVKIKPPSKKFILPKYDESVSVKFKTKKKSTKKAKKATKLKMPSLADQKRFLEMFM
jgi:hypothetical protein